MVAIGCVIKTPGSSKNNKTGSWRTFKIKKNVSIVTIVLFSVPTPV